MNFKIINKASTERKVKFLKKWGIKNNQNSFFDLIIKPSKIEILQKNICPKRKIFINFLDKKTKFRIKNLSKYKENIAKSIGIKKNYFPNVLDATAGFGKDSLILANLGCKVILIERNTIVSALLFEALKNMKNNKKTEIVANRIKLIYGCSFNILKKRKIKPDVIYLDPMYNTKKKIKSPSKKEVVFLQSIIGNDKDSDKLLPLSLQTAKNRVVVKRYKNLPNLNNEKPNFVIKGKTTRFDVYTISSNRI